MVMTTSICKGFYDPDKHKTDNGSVEQVSGTLTTETPSVKQVSGTLTTKNPSTSSIDSDIEALIKNKKTMPSLGIDWLAQEFQQTGSLTPYEMIIVKHCVSKLERNYVEKLISSTKKKGQSPLDDTISKLLVADQLLVLKPDTDVNLVKNILENPDLTFSALVTYTGIACEQQITHAMENIRAKGSNGYFLPKLKDMCINARISQLLNENVKAYAQNEYNPDNLKVLLVVGNIVKTYQSFDGVKALDIVDNIKANIDDLKDRHNLYFSNGSAGVDYFYVLESLTHLENENYTKALDIADKALQQNSNNRDAKLVRARALAGSGMIDESYTQLTKLATLDGSDLRHVMGEKVKLAYIVKDRQLIDKINKEYGDIIGHGELQEFLSKNIFSVTEEEFTNTDLPSKTNPEYFMVKLNLNSKKLGADISPLYNQVESGDINYHNLFKYVVKNNSSELSSLLAEQINGSKPEHLAAVSFSVNGNDNKLNSSELVRPEHFVRKIYDPYNKKVNYMLLDINLNLENTVQGGN